MFSRRLICPAARNRSASAWRILFISSVRRFLTPDISLLAHAPWILKNWSMQPSVKLFSSKRGSICRIWRRPVSTSFSLLSGSYAVIGTGVRLPGAAGQRIPDKRSLTRGLRSAAV